MTAQVTDQTKVVDQRFRSSEWGPESSEGMVKMVRGLPLPIAKDLTLGDMIDATPTDGICKVMLEEKLFETWSFKRSVLIGDGKLRLILFSCNFALYLCPLCKLTCFVLTGNF